MGHNRTTNLRSARAVLDHVAVNGKKTVLALALMVFMGFLWIRVLTGQKPGSVVAAPEPTLNERPESEAPVKVQFIELPKLSGRNDSIHRDFFAIQGRTYFRPNDMPKTGTETEVRVTTPGHAQEVIRRIAERLKLEAVLWSENPQAFVNDRLLKVGDTLPVKEGAETLNFEVLRINQNSVLVDCNGTQLTLRLAQFVEVNE
jgi:hypothetical protein